MKLILTPGMGIGPEVTARALKTLQLDAAITLMGNGATQDLLSDIPPQSAARRAQVQ